MRGTRISALLGTAALAAGALTVAAPATAATGSGSVTFTGCDVRTVEDDPTSRIGSRFSWSPTITISHPSPVRVSTEQRVGFTVSDLPAGKVPAATLRDLQVFLNLVVEHGDGGRSVLNGAWEHESWDGGAVPVGEGEDPVWTPAESQFQTWAVTGVELDVYGYDESDELHSYFLKCDPVAFPKQILKVAVYDPAAPAQVAVDRTSVKQGGTLRITARDFDPKEKVTVHLGSTKLATVTADAIGGVSTKVTVPETAKKGAQKVRLVGASKKETASTTVTVRLVTPTAKLSATSVKRGKKVTVTGTKFAPGEKVTVSVKAKKTTSKGTKSFSVTLRAKSTGKVSGKVTVPKKLAKGTYKVTVKGKSSGRTAKTVTLTVK